jgi:hypothetical protein
MLISTFFLLLVTALLPLPSTPAAAAAAAAADGVVFGRFFVANPDLPQRLALDAPLNPYNRCDVIRYLATARELPLFCHNVRVYTLGRMLQLLDQEVQHLTRCVAWITASQGYILHTRARRLHRLPIPRWPEATVAAAAAALITTIGAAAQRPSALPQHLHWLQTASRGASTRSVRACSWDDLACLQPIG